MVAIVWVLLETANIAVVKEADEQLEQSNKSNESKMHFSYKGV